MCMAATKPRKRLITPITISVSPTARAKARTDDEAFVAGRSLRTDITGAPLKPAPITAIRQGSAKRSWSGPAGGAARSGASGWQASME
jgi:hypothetical protein